MTIEWVMFLKMLGTFAVLMGLCGYQIYAARRSSRSDD